MTTADRLLQKYMLGQALGAPDYRTLHRAGYLAPTGNGWTITAAGLKQWGKDN